MVPLRLDPDQRFSCSQCGRCCRRGDVVVSQAEVDAYRQRDAGRWFLERDDAAEGAERDPFLPIRGATGFHRIRQREDGACGFLSLDNRCRLHQELGGRRKPLTCRLFPYRFHPAADAFVVTASFSCPTVVANTGERTSAGDALSGIKALGTEWFARHPSAAAPLQYVPGRTLDAESLRVLRESLLTMLNRPGENGRRDLGANLGRMAQSLEDLTRHRVVRLSDQAFAEYLSLTTRHAAEFGHQTPTRPPTRVGRLLQHGFLFVVAATRMRLENRGMSRFALRIRLLRLLAHFHRVGPRLGHVDLGALRRGRLDVNAPEIQPLAHHYLRSTIETLGTGERPVLDELAIAVSYLNVACALAAMNAAAAGRPVDRGLFGEALIEAVELTHSDQRGLLGRTLGLFSAGIDALYFLARSPRVLKGQNPCN